MRKKLFFVLLIKTLVFDLAYIGIGLYQEILGPTLPDLKTRVGANYEEISRSLSARSVGYLLGATCSGLIFDSLLGHAEIVFAALLFIGATTTAIIPWCTALWTLAMVNFFGGFSVGSVNPGFNAYCVQMWGPSKAAGPMSSLHFAFGLGAILSPIGVKDFISPPTSDNNTANQSSSNVTEPRIEIPYTIYGSYVFAVGLIFFTMYWFSNSSGKSRRPEINLKKIAREFIGLQREQKLIMLFFFCYYFFVVGGERIFGKFVFAFVTDESSEMKFSRDDAVFLTSLFWIGFTSGRFANIALSMFLHPTYLMLAWLVATLGNSLFLVAYASQNVIGIWIFTAAFGFFLGPLYPIGIAYANKRVNLNVTIMAFTDIGSGTGGIVFQWVTGLFFETLGVKSFPYILLVYGCGLTCIATALHGMLLYCSRSTSSAELTTEEGQYNNNNEPAKAGERENVFLQDIHYNAD